MSFYQKSSRQPNGNKSFKYGLIEVNILLSRLIGTIHTSSALSTPQERLPPPEQNISIDLVFSPLFSRRHFCCRGNLINNPFLIAAAILYQPGQIVSILCRIVGLVTGQQIMHRNAKTSAIRTSAFRLACFLPVSIVSYFWLAQ